MQLRIQLNLNLPQQDEHLIKKNIQAFFQERLQLDGISKSDYQVTEAEIAANIPVAECGFSQELLFCLRSNCIDYLDQFQKFNFSQVYKMLESYFGDASAGYSYAMILHHKMKKHGIPYANYASELMVPIKETALHARTKNTLIKANLLCLQDIAVLTRKQISMIPHFGRKGLLSLDKCLQKHHLWYAEMEKASEPKR